MVSEATSSSISVHCTSNGRRLAVVFKTDSKLSFESTCAQQALPNCPAGQNLNAACGPNGPPRSSGSSVALPLLAPEPSTQSAMNSLGSTVWHYDKTLRRLSTGLCSRLAAPHFPQATPH